MTNDNLPDEANRYDGAPAPQRRTPGAPPTEAIREEARRKLANKGCSEDGCDEDDPDRLGYHFPPADPPGNTLTGAPPVVLCEQHADEANDG